MTTREKVSRQLVLFSTFSDRKVLLLTGTHQYRKHILALSTIFDCYRSPSTVLFRTNHARNADDFLAPIIGKSGMAPRVKTGRPMNIAGGYRLFADTINPLSWKSTPSSIDVAVVYPIDSLDYDYGEKCVHDLMRRDVKKVFLVSWTDNVDGYGWTNQFDPVHVVYDAKEDDPEYHNRVLGCMSGGSTRRIPKKVSRYAQHVPHEYLMRIFCDKCRTTRWAELNKPYPGPTALKKAEAGEYTAKCVKCGYEAMDNYNWYT